jgi:hypothetical protein
MGTAGGLGLATTTRFLEKLARKSRTGLGARTPADGGPAVTAGAMSAATATPAAGSAVL